LLMRRVAVGGGPIMPVAKGRAARRP
jgi:hypothetical protein